MSSGEITLSGEAQGQGPSAVLCHGLTASRRYVLHGSTALARGGFRTIAYDARAHGQSSSSTEPVTYDVLATDLAAVIEATVPADQGVVAIGHSMGAHTIAALATAGGSTRLAAVILIGPAWAAPSTAEELEHWDSLAAGLERDGVDGFLAAYDRGLDRSWRDTLLRIATTRLEQHAELAGVARALREVPRSNPLDSLADLEAIAVPALVVGSRDEADPGHPLSVATAWAQRIPSAELVVEPEGASPLAWQGGRLTREIVRFIGERVPAGG